MRESNSKAVWTPCGGSPGSSPPRPLKHSSVWKFSRPPGQLTCVYLSTTYYLEPSLRSCLPHGSSESLSERGRKYETPLRSLESLLSPTFFFLTQPQQHVWNEGEFNYKRCKVTPGDKIHKRTLAYCSTRRTVFFSVVDTATISPFMPLFYGYSW